MKINIVLFTFISFFLLSLNMNAQYMLAKGSKIAMADNTKKNIEKIVVGDKVLAYNAAQKVYEEVAIKSINKKMFSRMARLTLNSGIQLTMTAEQPFWSEKGWVSVNPNITKTNEKYKDTRSIEIGNFAFFYNSATTDFVEVTVIQGILEPTQAYSLELENNMAYVANGFLIGQN